MKSFEQFEYEQSPITEIVGVDVSKRFAQKNKTQVTTNSTTQGARSPVPPRNMEGGATPSKAPSIPQRPQRPGYRRSDGSKKPGIQATLDRNKAKAAAAAGSKSGQRKLSAAGGAVAGFAKFRPDTEDATTGTGLGTNMRALARRGRATVAGGIDAYKRKKKEQEQQDLPKRSKVTGSGQQTGKTGSTGVSSLLGKAVKSIGKKALGVKDDKVKTTGGRTITGDAVKKPEVKQEKRYREGQKRRQDARKTAEDKYRQYKEKPRKQTSNVTSKSPQQSIDSTALKKFNTSPDNKIVKKQEKVASKDDAARKQVEKDSGESIKGGSIVRSPGGKVATTGSASDEAKKNFDKLFPKKNKKLTGSKPDQPKLTSTDKKGGETDSPIVKGAISAAEKESKRRKKADAGADRLMSAMRKQGKKDDATPQSKAITVKATTVPKKKEEKPKEQKLKRPNVRSYKGDEAGYRKAQAAYNAQKPENKTKKTTQGRPKKTEVKEATNFIKAEQEAKRMGRRKMRTYKQMKEDEARERAINKLKQKNESYSDWREEFLWEIDKKYPDKVKEIKPMSGKNTIIINPEDESAKYKRGY